jgi:predicted O-methyltransferase YrrM
VKRLSKKQMVPAGGALAGVAVLALIIALLEPSYGLAVLAVLGAVVAAYLVRGVRRTARSSASSLRSYRAIEKKLREHETHLEGTVASLSALVSQDRFELVAALEAQAKAVHAVSDQVANVREELRTAVPTGSFHRLGEQLGGLGTEARRMVDRAERSNYAQIEALLELRELLPRRAPMPPMRGWPAAPTTILRLVEAVLHRRPALVVECGSGASSLWIGYALEKIGSGRCIALEHEPEFAQNTRDALERHGLTAVVEVRDAPLRPVDIAGETFDWYDVEALRDVQDIGVVFVDGPPKATGPLARFPALPVLEPMLSPRGAVILMDDADRAAEKAAVQRWCDDYDASINGSSTVEAGWTELCLRAH